MFELKFSEDRKVRTKKGDKNSFGITPRSSCPGKTSVCDPYCYACFGFMSFGNAKKMYAENYKQLQTILKLGEKGITLATDKFVEKINKETKGDIYRWDIGGDLFCDKFLEVQVRVAERLPLITFWNYTRSFEVVENWWIKRSRRDKRVKDIFPKNYKLNLSLDRENYQHKQFGVILNSIHTVTWLGEDIKEAVKKTRSRKRKWIVCPADGGKLALDGACNSCKLCFKGNGSKFGIFFPLRKPGSKRAK